MGRYSLENYEQYKTCKIRPKHLPKPPRNVDYIERVLKQQPMIAINDVSQIKSYRELNRPFGLVVYVSDEQRLECCESLAKQGLQHVWKHCPIHILLDKSEVSPSLMEDLRRWHGTSDDASLDLGFNIRLRRVTYPEEISSGGALPIRFWFENTGTAPIYNDVQLKVKLVRSGKGQTYNIDMRTMGWAVGDVIENHIVRLKDMAEGSYELWIGVEAMGEGLLLDVDLPSHNGDYLVGTIKVDQTPRDELFTIWERYYPEGYYPLEDPEVPDSN